LLKLKFEEAEQSYNLGNCSQSLVFLSELETAGLSNPRILHLKIMATGNKLDLNDKYCFKIDLMVKNSW
jgi:hypothetical protein